jgi:hypothetical protein
MAMKVRPSASSISWIVQMIGVIQRGRSLGFPLKAAPSVCVVGELVGKELQGDVTTELEVFDLVHNTHAPAADPAEDAVMGNCLTHGLKRRRHWRECYVGAWRGVNDCHRASPSFSTMR